MKSRCSVFGSVSRFRKSARPSLEDRRQADGTAVDKMFAV